MSDKSTILSSRSWDFGQNQTNSANFCLSYFFEILIGIGQFKAWLFGAKKKSHQGFQIKTKKCFWSENRTNWQAWK